MNTGTVDPEQAPWGMPATFSTEQATMQLRWYDGVLEQGFIRNGAEMVWRPIPAIGHPRPVGV